MFRHPHPDNASVPTVPAEEKTPDAKAVRPESAPVTLFEVKELLEKNLKWSQIIYEQNRRIKNRMLWSAIGSWLKVLLILIPLGLAVWFLPPIAKDVWGQYQSLTGKTGPAKSLGSSSLDSFLNILQLDSAKQEQLKAILK